MITPGTKCTIKAVPPDTSIYEHLIGREVQAEPEAGKRGTGSQRFTFEGAHIFGNADTGFVVEAKA